MCRMCDPVQIKTFALAGKAIITLQSAKTGARYTYKIAATKDRPDRFFVNMLTGPDNTSDYSYIGFLSNGFFRTTKSSKLTDDSIPVVAFRFFVAQVINSQRNPETVKLEVFHEGRCGRCGRPLTVPESIERGIGPDCAEKMGMGA